jgi:cell wall-associated NlpC family hydrolase
VATFIYAPAIKVHIETSDGRILDISDDIVNWELIRRSNAVSSFNFVLQNTQRKYDLMFKPADRISVLLKRITWMRVFTGSINVVPLFSSWPATLTLSASCSLKKLQFWPWNPSTSASNSMIQKYLSQLKTDTTKGDAGLSGLITESLTAVTDWDPKAIHIGAVPNAWFEWAKSTEQLIDAASDMAAVLGPHSTIGGSTFYGNFSLPPAAYGDSPGMQLDATQTKAAASIYAVVVGQSGLKTQAEQDRAALLTLMVAGAESSFNPPTGQVDHSSLGLFQQQSWWGTAQQRQDVAWSTLAFLKGATATTNGAHISGLFDMPSWQSGDPGTICQKVQVSAYPDRYSLWQSAAQAIVIKLRQQVTSQFLDRSHNAYGTGPSDGIPTGSPTSNATADQLAKVAYDLISSRPPGTILYSQERGTHASDPRNPNPTRLDCSSLVSWCYYHATGKIWAGTNTRTQWPLCPVQNIPLERALYIRGALLFNISGGTPEHVGISLGNGQHVAAHESGIPAADQVNISPTLTGGFSTAALAPGIDYTHAATTQAVANYLTTVLHKPCHVATTDLNMVIDPSVAGGAGTTTNDPFQQIVSVLGQPIVVSGDLFGGPRELMNNQPFLPWLQNLTNSSMRAFCSAPNGDFIAWFPDYFNVWETAAIMDVKLIELQDFTVEWSDQQIVTHEFVLGSYTPGFDIARVTKTDSTPPANESQVIGAMLSTKGIATMDFPAIFKTIYGKPASPAFMKRYLERFGARPNVEQMPNIKSPSVQEFYMALWLFNKHWAEQFNATIPMTFMPELWPGMIIQIQHYGFQAYVSEVTHRGSYGQNGRFTTEAKIIAPAPIDPSERSSLFGMFQNMFDDGNGARSKQHTSKFKRPTGTGPTELTSGPVIGI